jgi:type 1 glutamine amidotransferase
VGIVNYNAALNVLVSVKGHPYPRDAFSTMLDSMDNMACTIVEQPASQAFMTPTMAAPYDALVFYDMPGVDFSTQPPTLVAPPAELQEGFLQLLEAGMGMVFLHHALAAWPLWEAFGDILGGRFFYNPQVCKGLPVLDSGYRHEVDYKVTVVDTSHPVTQGLPANFALQDELYLCEIFEADIHPLLSCDYGFESGNFYSAQHAVTGRMYCNDHWPHPSGSPLLGWTRQIGDARIVYLQPGDTARTMEDSHYRQLLENAVHWVAGKA